MKDAIWDKKILLMNKDSVLHQVYQDNNKSHHKFPQQKNLEKFKNNNYKILTFQERNIKMKDKTKLLQFIQSYDPKKRERN